MAGLEKALEALRQGGDFEACLARLPDEVAEEVRAFIMAAPSALAAGVNPGPGSPISARNLPEPGDRLGDFVVEGLIGQGGMGSVFLARQSSPRRAVALKVMRVDRSTGESGRRFLHEAQILGRLRHPNIAQVFHADDGVDTGGVAFIAMEFVPDARDLSGHVRERCVDLDGRLGLFVKVCRALHEVHLRGVVHRDLKPANIIVGPDDEPKVIDFGVARNCRTTTLQSMQTKAGGVIGTLAYMSPEQCRGESHRADRRTDIYSLGVILFELVSGKRPYSVEGLSLPEVVRVVEAGRVPSVFGSGSGGAGDLDSIIRVAMATEPDRRYGTAAELADDVERFRAGLPIHARETGLAYHLWLYARRNKILVAGMLAALLAVLVALVVVWISSRTVRETDDRLRLQILRGEFQRAWQAISVGDRFEAFETTAASAVRRGKPLDSWEIKHLKRGSFELRAETPSLGAQVDGVLLAASRGALLASVRGRSGLVALDLAAGDGATTVTVDSTVANHGHYAAAIDSRERFLVATWRHGVDIYRIGAKAPISLEPLATLSSPVEYMTGRCSIAIKDCGDEFHIFAGGERGEVVVWSVPVEEGIPAWERFSAHSWQGHEGAVGAIVLAADGLTLVSGGADDGTIAVWNVGEILEGLDSGTAPASRQRLQDAHTCVLGLAIDQSGSRLASAGRDSVVKIWSMEGLEDGSAAGNAGLIGPLHRIDCARSGATCVVFDLDDGIVIGDGDGWISLWSPSRLGSDRLSRRHAHAGPVNALAMGKDGHVTTAGSDGRVKSWSLPRPTIRSAGRIKSSGRGAFALGDGHRVLSLGCGDPVQLSLWDTETAAPVFETTIGRRPLDPTAAAFDRARGRLLVALEPKDGDVGVELVSYRVGRDDAKEVASLALYPGAGKGTGEVFTVVDLAISESGGRFVGGDSRGGILVGEFDGSVLSCKRIESGIDGAVRVLPVDPDGELLLVVEAGDRREKSGEHSSGAAVIIERRTGRARRRINLPARVNGLDFDLDRGLVALAMEDGGLCLIRRGEFEESGRVDLRRIEVDATPLACVAFHPSEPRLFVGDIAGCIGIVDLDERLHEFPVAAISGVIWDLEVDPVSGRVCISCNGRDGDYNGTFVLETAGKVP